MATYSLAFLNQVNMHLGSWQRLSAGLSGNHNTGHKDDHSPHRVLGDGGGAHPLLHLAGGLKVQLYQGSLTITIIFTRGWPRRILRILNNLQKTQQFSLKHASLGTSYRSLGLFSSGRVQQDHWQEMQKRTILWTEVSS